MNLNSLIVLTEKQLYFFYILLSASTNKSTSSFEL